MTARGAWILLAAVAAVLVAGVVWLDRRQTDRGAPSILTAPWRAAAARRAPPPGARPARGGRIAVIVDELGGRGGVLESLVALGRPVTVAVLPDLPLSRRIAREAVRAGLELLVQVPLEPYRFPEQDPGPGVLLISMSPDEVTRRIRHHLAAVPGAAGVTTRMGSRFSADRARMRALLEPVVLQGLFFVDPVATPESLGYDLARALGVPAARRQVFIDPDDTEATARRGLAEVERRAVERGAVVAVARGRTLTVRLLAEAMPRWEARGLTLVPVSHLLDRRRTTAPVRRAA